MEYFETGNRGHYRHLCPQGRGLDSLSLDRVCVYGKWGAHHRPSKTVICPSNCNFFVRLSTFPDRFRVERSIRRDAKCRARPPAHVQPPNVDQMVSWKPTPTDAIPDLLLLYSFYLFLLLLLHYPALSFVKVMQTGGELECPGKREKRIEKPGRFCHAKHAGHCGNTSLIWNERERESLHISATCLVSNSWDK